MPSDYGQRHALQRFSRIADNAEIHALRNGSSTVDNGLVDERIADADDDISSEIADIELWHDLDLKLESGTGGALERINRRVGLLGDQYPFGSGLPTLAYSPTESLVYEFCLSICTSPTLTTGDYVKLPRVFERLACILVETYIGFGANSHHLGWPRDANCEEIKFRDAIEPVYHRTGEWYWNPDPALPESPTVQEVKDGGLDLLAWKLMDDRTGSLFFLGNCACGDNWKTKLDEVSLEDLKKWFQPMARVSPPVKLFLTPHDVVNPLITDASRRAGVILDRIRLTQLASRCAQLEQHVKLMDGVKASWTCPVSVDSLTFGQGGLASSSPLVGAIPRCGATPSMRAARD